MGCPPYGGRVATAAREGSMVAGVRQTVKRLPECVATDQESHLTVSGVCAGGWVATKTGPTPPTKKRPHDGWMAKRVGGNPVGEVVRMVG